MRMKLAFSILALVPLIVLAAGLLVQEIAFRGPLKSRVEAHQSEMNRDLSTFLEDQEALSRIDVIRTNNGGRDAGPFLNPIVRWYAGMPEGARYLAGKNNSPISIPNGAAAQLSGNLYKLFDASSQQFDYASFSLDWMKEALAYDYWEIHEAPPIREMFDRARSRKIHMLNYLTLTPLPELKDIVLLSKVRLIKGMKERNLLPALREVRHLAKLCYSTETLHGALFAVVLLGVERVGYEYAVAHQVLKGGDWMPLSPDLYKRLKRAVLGASGYFSPITTIDLFRKTYGSGKVIVGNCAGIREGTTWFSLIDRHLYSQFPLERNFREVIDLLKMHATGSNSQCRLKDIRTYWSDPFAFSAWGFERDTLLLLAQGGEGFWITSGMISYPLPYFRRAAGLALAIFSRPSAYRWYEKNESQPE